MWTLLAYAGEGMDNGSYDHMMDGGWANNGGFAMFWMFAIAVLITAGVIYLFVHGSKKNGKSDNDDPMTIIKSRYAKGELSKKQFDEMKNDIK